MYNVYVFLIPYFNRVWSLASCKSLACVFQYLYLYK